MAFVFQPDPSLADFNSFCDVSFADDYQSTKLNAAWASITTDTKQKLLVWSSRLLSQLDWEGSKTVITQPLEWPRKYVYIKGSSGCTDYWDQHQFPWNEIPTFLKEACADQAGYLLEGDTTEPTGLEGYSRLKVDVIEVETNATDRLAWLPSSTRTLCSRYLLNSSKYTVRTQRVG